MARPLLLACLLLAAPDAVAADAMPLPAQHAANLKASEARAVASAASFLAAAQGDFRAPDGKGRLQATWPFGKGSEIAAPNAAGVVATALVAVHRKTGDAAALESARRWGLAQLGRLDRATEMFDPDVEALAALAKLPGPDAGRFADAARRIFEARHGGADGREIVERLFLVRKGCPSLVGYDGANTLRAALAVGEEAKARQIAKALEATAPRWNVAHEHGFHLTSRASVLEALVAAAIDSPLQASLRKQVVESQGADGSWGTRNTQATAYSVRALAAAGDSAAAGRGLRFLRATQLQGGGWGTFNDFLPEPFVGETVYEVSAEVVLALLKGW